MTNTKATVATDITFLEDRARVRRTAAVSLQAGVQSLKFEGLSLLVDDSSVIVRIVAPDDDVKVLATRVHRLTRTVRTAQDAQIEALQDQELASRRAHEAARARALRIERQLARTIAVEHGLLEQAKFVPSLDDGDWGEAFDTIEARVMAHSDARAKAQEQVDETQRAHQLAAAKLELGRRETPEIVSYLEVQIESDTAQAVDVEIAYVVPCALWRPSHLAALDLSTKTIVWQTMATVWQQTGEVWRDVMCHFSTARPASASSPPLLTEDRLRARPKTEEEKRTIEVEARDVEISLAGVGGGGRTVSEMPGVDDGGEPLTLTAAERVTIPSTGAPFRVQINTTELKAMVGRVATPELSPAPHLRAKATWLGDVPLLAGPVMLMREGEFTGRSKVAFVGQGDLFELGFGIDNAVRVGRDSEEEHETSRMTGKQTLTRTITLYLSNLSSQRQALTVRERVPVSEIKEVSVKGVAMGAEPDDDGFVDIEFALPPNTTRTHQMTYRIEFSGKVSLSL